MQHDKVCGLLAYKQWIFAIGFSFLGVFPAFLADLHWDNTVDWSRPPQMNSVPNIFWIRSFREDTFWCPIYIQVELKSVSVMRCDKIMKHADDIAKYVLYLLIHSESKSLEWQKNEWEKLSRHLISEHR